MADGKSITRWGVQFELADKIGLMPLMRFAHIARSGVDSDDMEGLDAMYTLLRQCFTDEAWPRFEDVSSKNAAQGDELFAVVTEAISAMTERPTGRPSDSSDGSPATNVNSVGDSSSEVIDRLIAEGRPSVAFVIEQRNRAGLSLVSA